MIIYIGSFLRFCCYCIQDWIGLPVYLRKVDASYEKRASKLNTDQQIGLILR